MFKKTKKDFYTSSLLQDSKFFYGFGTKDFTDTNIREMNPKNIVMLKQVHGDEISYVENYFSDKMSTISDVDGIITKLSNVVLIVKTADCVPIIYVDIKSGIIGISHQGYKGTLLRISQKMITKMVNVGSKVENIIALIGPSIGGCCYEVSQQRFEDFKTEFKDLNIVSIKDNKYFLDLPLINFQLLEKMGVKKEHIDNSKICTRHNDEFYSFRRDQTSQRMVNFISIV